MNEWTESRFQNLRSGVEVDTFGCSSSSSSPGFDPLPVDGERFDLEVDDWFDLDSESDDEWSGQSNYWMNKNFQ